MRHIQLLGRSPNEQSITVTACYSILLPRRILAFILKLCELTREFDKKVI